ncbi:MAG: hypothetical protein ACT4PJ_14185 [Gemmatimonadaceae bacterium]
MTVSAPYEPIVHFRSTLWAELRRAGVLPDDARYDEGRRAVTRAGVQECALLERAIGHRLWNRGLVALHRPHAQADCVRVLGFGRLLTEFLLPAHPIDRSAHDDVLHLGALANLIVALFDHFADNSTLGAQMLSPASLERACGGSRAHLRWRSLFGAPEGRLIARLVLEYFRRLDRLPFARRRTGVGALVSRAILAMYAAELATLQQAQPSKKVLRRKCALPLVVMALPAWLAVERIEQSKLRSHVRYAYRVGEFIGAIDDAADADLDLVSGRSNGVLQALHARGAAPDILSSNLAREIAREGVRLLEEQPGLAVESKDRDHARDALGLVVRSWLSGEPA